MNARIQEPQMEYNSQRSKMIISEYGRNIQKMIEHAVSLEDKEERNKAARAIVKVMGQLNPSLRDLTDFSHKLWDHLFIISEFKLDADSPYEMPEPNAIKAKPARVPYPGNPIKYKHYGRFIERIIEEVKLLEEGPKKEYLSGIIANFMKMTYLTFNRDTVSDEMIVEQLAELSDDGLKLASDFQFVNTNDILQANNQSNAAAASQLRKKNTKHKRHKQKFKRL
jgi:hypothetical protein